MDDPTTACDHPDLNHLYLLVTNLILDAERDKEPDPNKYLSLSLVESTIASLLPASSLEGMISREGAIMAAMIAKQPMRVIRLLAAYTHVSGRWSLDAAILISLEDSTGWRPVPAPRGLPLLMPL